MRISDWSSDVCSSDLRDRGYRDPRDRGRARRYFGDRPDQGGADDRQGATRREEEISDGEGCRPLWHFQRSQVARGYRTGGREMDSEQRRLTRSEEHTSELQSLMRISYADFCLTKKNHKSM